MKRRDYLAALTLIPTLPLTAHAGSRSLRVGIFPGTGSADTFRDELRAAPQPFARTRAEGWGVSPG